MVNFGSRVDVPWPVATDNLIGSGDEWQAIACLESAQGSDVVRALGYQRAAEVMFEEIRAGRDQDLLIYPLAFCWRHHLELQLKTLILAASHFLDEPLSDTNEAELHRHRLVPLWAICRPLLDRIEPHEPADLDTAGRQIAQMHQIDPRGEAFRYAASKTGKRHPVTVKRGQIAVDRFHRVCTGLSTFLSACADQIDYYRMAGPAPGELAL